MEPGDDQRMGASWHLRAFDRGKAIADAGHGASVTTVFVDNDSQCPPWLTCFMSGKTLGSDHMFLSSDPVTYYTPLHIAVLRNQPDMVELLARHGADINRRDRVQN